MSVGPQVLSLCTVPQGRPQRSCHPNSPAMTHAPAPGLCGQLVRALQLLLHLLQHLPLHGHLLLQVLVPGL